MRIVRKALNGMVAKVKQATRDILNSVGDTYGRVMDSQVPVLALHGTATAYAGYGSSMPTRLSTTRDQLNEAALMAGAAATGPMIGTAGVGATAGAYVGGAVGNAAGRAAGRYAAELIGNLNENALGMLEDVAGTAGMIAGGGAGARYEVRPLSSGRMNSSVSPVRIAKRVNRDLPSYEEYSEDGVRRGRIVNSRRNNQHNGDRRDRIVNRRAERQGVEIVRDPENYVENVIVAEPGIVNSDSLYYPLNMEVEIYDPSARYALQQEYNPYLEVDNYYDPTPDIVNSQLGTDLTHEYFPDLF